MYKEPGNQKGGNISLLGDRTFKTISRLLMTKLSRQTVNVF